MWVKIHFNNGDVAEAELLSKWPPEKSLLGKNLNIISIQIRVHDEFQVRNIQDDQQVRIEIDGKMADFYYNRHSLYEITGTLHVI